MENDWLTIGPITDNTNLLLLYAAIIGAANPMATGEGDGWHTILEAPNWTVDLQPDHVIQGGATVTFYIVNSNGQGRKGMPVEITTDASIPTPPLNPDSSTDTTTSTTDSSSDPSSDSSTDTITGTTDPSSDSTTDTTTNTTDSSSEPISDSSTDTTTSTTDSSTTEILGINERNSSSTASAIAPSSKQTPSSAKRYPQTNMEPDQLFFTFLGTGLLAAAVFLGFSRKH